MTTCLHTAIREKNVAFARLHAMQTAVARWPYTTNPLPAKMAADQLAAEIEYQQAQARVDELLQCRRDLACNLWPPIGADLAQLTAREVTP
jgi:hypothetical protein